MIPPVLALLNKHITEAKGQDVPFIKASCDSWMKGNACALCARPNTGATNSSEFAHMSKLLQSKKDAAKAASSGGAGGGSALLLPLRTLEQLQTALHKTAAHYALLVEPLQRVEKALPRFTAAVARGGSWTRPTPSAARHALLSWQRARLQGMQGRRWTGLAARS